jgi:hypothetical protein
VKWIAWLAAPLLAACAGNPPGGAHGFVADPLARPGVVALIFVRTDCPIANRYAPTLRALAEEHGARGTRFVLVYPDQDATPEAIDRHRGEYSLALDALRDPGHAWVRRTGARMTPEAAVYDRARRLVYRGRIDDRFPLPGVARDEPRVRDLDLVLDLLERGERLEFTSQPAVGCPIPELP